MSPRAGGLRAPHHPWARGVGSGAAIDPDRAGRKESQGFWRKDSANMGWPRKEPAERTPSLISLPPSVLRPAPLTGQTQEKPEAARGHPSPRRHSLQGSLTVPAQLLFKETGKALFRKSQHFPFFFFFV